MVSQNAIACLLIVTGIALLAIVNELGWLVLMVPVALLVARSFMYTGRPRNSMAGALKKG
jgi:hypothetical protein